MSIQSDAAKAYMRFDYAVPSVLCANVTRPQGFGCHIGSYPGHSTIEIDGGTFQKDNPHTIFFDQRNA